MSVLIQRGYAAAITGVLALGGRATSDILALLPAFLSSSTSNPNWVLINLGTNDIPKINVGTVTQASWLSDTGSILDQIHAKWPAAHILVTKSYYGGNSNANAEALLSAWTNQIIASRPSFVGLGLDEPTFLPGNTSDSTHPNATGYSLTVARWLAAMGL